MHEETAMKNRTTLKESNFLFHTGTHGMDKINNTSARVLIVEDNDDDYEVTFRALEEAGLKNPVIRCDNGDDVLDYMAGDDMYADKTKFPRPGLILLDLNIPGANGRDVLAEIRATELWKLIPVIVFTTSDDPKDIQHCYDSGANSYIRKPVDIDRFFNAISTLKSYWFEVNVFPKIEDKEVV